MMWLLQVVQGHQSPAGYVAMLLRASVWTEGPHLCGDEELLPGE